MFLVLSCTHCSVKHASSSWKSSTLKQTKYDIINWHNFSGNCGFFCHQTFIFFSFSWNYPKIKVLKVIFDNNNFYFLTGTHAYVSKIKNNNKNKELGQERCRRGESCFFFCFKMLSKQTIEDPFEYYL